MIAHGGRLASSPSCCYLSSSPTTKLTKLKLTLLCYCLAVILPFAISDDSNTTESAFGSGVVGSVVESVVESVTDLVPDSMTGLIPGTNADDNENSNAESSNTDNTESMSTNETTIQLIPGSTNTENSNNAAEEPVDTELELTMEEESADANTETTIPESTTTTNTFYDCIDPGNPELTSIVRRGEITTLCLYVGPEGDWNDNIKYKRFSVNLQADEFSSYHIPGSYNALTVTGTGTENQRFNNDNSTHIFAASQASLSFLRRYYDQTTKRIYPYLTAILDVQQGIVRGIAWDDACVFCETAECLPNTYNLNGSLATTEQMRQPVNGCSYSKNECRLFAKDGNDICDLNLHVVWTGTDVDGKVLLSSDSRPSAFPPNRIQENVKGRYDKMVKSLSDFKDQALGG